MKAEKTISCWAEALFLTQKDKPEKEKEKIMERLVRVLKKTKKEHLLEKILKRFEKVFQRENRVELIFARDLSPAFLETVKKKLRNVLGPSKEIETRVDEDIIGGFRIKTGNLLVKASLKDFLDDLAGSLK
ncbi:MAG: F0F1 ATP synthase subunit delta [bacterium]|nr:F0F1 ATP synthase subunit delta [bacterium]